MVLLSLVPGLLALTVYYRGLRTAPASLATFAELAFPSTSVLVNWVAFGTTLSGTQWAGLALLSGAVLTLGGLGRRGSSTLGVGVAPRRVPSTA